MPNKKSLSLAVQRLKLTTDRHDKNSMSRSFDPGGGLKSFLMIHV